MSQDLTIMLTDLKSGMQKEVLAFYGCQSTEEGNLDVVPLFVLERDEPGRKEPSHERIHVPEDVPQAASVVKAECPGCGALSGEWDFIQKVSFNAESICADYTCQKCGSRIVQHFTLTDISIDNRHAS